jgi:hypothetical protein
MIHPIHKPAVEVIHVALGLMDALMRDQMTMDDYARKLRTLNVDDLLAAHQADFKQDPGLVYYLDALMLLSSLQHELEYQVAEYGANVASEDMKCLRELLVKFGDKPKR